MDIYSAAEAARRLDTSIPRVVRHAERLGLHARAPSGRFCISPQMLSRLEDELGRVPRVDGLGPPQVQVLAALGRAPLGLASARNVARQARVAPTTASRALKALEGKGLVYHEDTKIAAGRTRRVRIYHANPRAKEWRSIEPCLRRTRPKKRPERRDEVVPPRLRHLFWNTAPSQLVLSHAGPYIAERLLTTFDLDGLSWGSRNLRASDWEGAAGARELDARTRALALNLAEEADDGQG